MKQSLPDLDQIKIIAAASRTWAVVASDVASLGRVTLPIALESVLDADRIVMIGKLDSEIIERVGYSQCEKILRKHKGKWYY